MLVLAGRGTKIQVSFCCNAGRSPDEPKIPADLNPFGSMDARRAERSPDEPKIPRFAR